MKIRIFLVILIILAAANFYNPFGLISPQASKFVFYFSSLSLWIISCSKTNTLRSIKRFPKISYYLILVGIIGALFMAIAFQEQSFSVSLIAILPYFFAYLSLFLFIKSGIGTDVIKKIIFGLLCCSIIIYIINYTTFPLMPFGNMDADDVDSSRGIIRIGILYLDLFVLGMFYSINQWLLVKKRKWLLAVAVCGLMIVLSVTRQLIVITAVLGILFFMKKASVYQKIIFVAIILVFTVYILPEIPIYKALVETTQNQMNRTDNREDPRIRAARFFLEEYQTNEMTRIFGNGKPSIGNSPWGNEYGFLTHGEGCYPSDVGWIGFYWHFGLLGTIGVFLLLFHTARLRKSRENEYLTYYFYAIILLSILSAPILVYRQIVDVMLVLSLTYKLNNKRRTINAASIRTTAINT